LNAFPNCSNSSPDLETGRRASGALAFIARVAIAMRATGARARPQNQRPATAASDQTPSASGTALNVRVRAGTTHLVRISRAERMVSRNFLRVLAMACACAAAACGSTNVSNVTAPSNARCGSSITGLPGSLGAGGGQFPVTIATARECQWRAESDSPWLQITPATGQGEAEVSVVVAANPVGTVRTGSVVVNGTTMSVRQDAAACQITWKESSVEVPASGGSLTIGVSATAGCSWAASTTASWLRGTRTSGTGDGSAEFVANASDGTERTATLRVGDASATEMGARGEINVGQLSRKHWRDAAYLVRPDGYVAIAIPNQASALLATFLTDWKLGRTSRR